MVKGEFTVREVDWIKVCIYDRISHGGNVDTMRELLDLYEKIDNYSKELLEENSVNE